MNLNFVESKEWKLVLGLGRILLVLLVVGLLFYIYSEVETLKLLGGDVCKMCEKTTDKFCYTIQP